MHKYFAKTLFIGKKAEYLPECQSTNAELRTRLSIQKLPEGYLLHTDYQHNGRGQRGSGWESEAGANLLFSLLLKPSKLLPSEAYWLNIVAALGIAEALESHLHEAPYIKWPNDIYIHDSKISGILIETSIDQGKLAHVVVGIGLNVNQTSFFEENATSMALHMGTLQDRQALLEDIALCIERWYLKLLSGEKEQIRQAYYDRMYWRGERHTFEISEGLVHGEIIGIDQYGNLVISHGTGLSTYDIKAIRFVN